MWENYTHILNETCKRKFRSTDDVTILLATLWQIFSGRYIPVKRNYFGTVVALSPESIECIRSIINSDQYRIICLNDNESMDVADKKAILKLQQGIIHAFEKKHPNKSLFEI